MTDPRGKRPSMLETVQTTDGFLRHAGRDFLVVLYTAFRSLKLYPIENAQDLLIFSYLQALIHGFLWW